MLAQDKTAFVEQIEVIPDDKKAAKRRRRVAAARIQALQLAYEMRLSESVVRNMERELLERDPSVDRPPIRRKTKASEQDLEAARARLTKKQNELSAKHARVSRLEQKASESVAAARALKTFRLHSEGHYVECSERRFAEWSATQRTNPVRVTTEGGRRWWWYSDRFWWDTEGLNAEEIMSLVFELDHEGRHQRDSEDQLRADLFRRKPHDASS